ncbi:methyl-accepting chemotaxis protein [Acetonema longum]|uniref:Methyl-accepting chemotaxis protein n=1 Tax=Acetonema longum DSM 6540 TaxID=1009370 RepID=F7NDS3_9FIRM|nr:methyl-accepting chemotaxis protein [Acetonema longum]EGO65794.1 methyl-accepting chemotaxis protein [Acetonema longum DSM 6540]
MVQRKRFSLLLQVLGMYLLIIVLFVSSAIFSIYNFKVISAEIKDVSTHTVPRMIMVKETHRLFSNALLNMRGLLLYGGGSTYEAGYRKDIGSALNEIEKLVETSTQESTRNQSEKLLREIREYQAFGDRIIRAQKANAANLAELTAQGRFLVDTINADFDKMSEIQVRFFDTKTEGMNQHIAAAEGIVTVVSFVISVLSMILAFIYSKNLIKRISELNKVIEQTGQLDLTPSSYKSSMNDEINDMLVCLETMRMQVRETVAHVQSSSSTLAAACEELTVMTEEFSRSIDSVAGNVTDMAGSATASAASITDISATIQEVSASAEEMSAGAAQIDKTAQTAVTESQTGMNLLEEVVNQNEVIANSMGKMQDATLALNTSSEQIKRIISVISNIAGQTNLLALNAAIEAARAGEAGRGFAVVAEEVRRLAEQSEGSTKEIASIIHSISTEINNITAISSATSVETGKGKEVAFHTQKGFQKIIDQLERIGLSIKEMSRSAEEITQGTQGVAGSVQAVSETASATSGKTQNVAAVTEEQAATMTEIARNVDRLAELAIQMNEKASQFRV